MIRLIARKPIVTSDAAGGRVLADPDLLSTLAAELRHSPSVELEEAFSRMMHDLRIAGTWKRTNRGRLPVAERMVCEHVRPALGAQTTILDLGASDGITTLDLLHRLRDKFGGMVGLVLADVSLWLFRYRRGPLVEYRSSAGEAIMARIGPLGLRLSRSRQGGGSGDRLAALYFKCDALRRLMRPDGRISLIHPLVEAEEHITATELNCLVREPSLVNRFSAVRASNVLNLGYFNTAELNAALSNVHAYLQRGGCLVVSRNQDTQTGEVENGTAWRKQLDRFQWLESFGASSEIKQIVDAWRTDR